MPVYEFYCERCNRVFNFFSRTVNTEKVPACPRCTGLLKRQMSLFAKVTSGKEEPVGGGSPSDFDEARMGKAMAMLAGEAERINENDPRQAAQLMRKLADATGLSLAPGMEEALHRLERGDDPDQIDAEIGDLLEAEEPFAAEGPGKKGEARAKPLVDETLYDL